MNKEQQIEEFQNDIIDNLFNGGTYGLAEALYNAGYRKTFISDFASNMKSVIKIEKKNAVKEFAEKLQKELPCRDYTLNGITFSMILASSMKYAIDKLLKEYEQ